MLNKYLERNMYPFEIRFTNNLDLHHKSSTAQSFDIFEPSNKIGMVRLPDGKIMASWKCRPGRYANTFANMHQRPRLP